MFWIDNIPLKNINPFKLNNKIQTILNNMTTLSSVLIFDIEFQTFKYEKHLLEMGGILFKKEKDGWYYYCNFYFNLPVIKPITKLNVIQSDYINVSNKTKLKIIKIENNYLYYKKLEKYKDDPNKFIKYYNKIKNSSILKKRNLNLDINNPKQVIKKLKDISFTLKLNDIGKENFNTIWQLYLNDNYVKKRTINPTIDWLKSFYQTLSKSLLMVKGNMDIIAINNLMIKYKLPQLPKTIKIYDIAYFNNIFLKLCQNAKLEGTYDCIIEKKLLDPEFKPDLKKIFSSLVLIDKKLIAHNPLVDSFYTLIVGLTMYSYPKE
jgi:hypothetical protein